MNSIIEIVRGVIENQQEAGEALPLPAQAVAHVLVWTTWHACYEWLSHERQFTEEELLEALERIWERTIWGGERS